MVVVVVEWRPLGETLNVPKKFLAAWRMERSVLLTLNFSEGILDDEIEVYISE